MSLIKEASKIDGLSYKQHVAAGAIGGALGTGTFLGGAKMLVQHNENKKLPKEDRKSLLGAGARWFRTGAAIGAIGGTMGSALEVKNHHSTIAHQKKLNEKAWRAKAKSSGWADRYGINV